MTFNVLVACEESQAISSAIRRFAKKNKYKINAWSCDLLPTSAKSDASKMTGPKYHLRGDAIKIISYDDTLCDDDYILEFIDRHPKKSGQRTDKSTLISVLDIIKTKGWDMVISNPPCTYLAVSGARWYYDLSGELDHHPRFPNRRLERAQSLRFFMSIALSPAKYIIIENPVGTLRSNLESSEYNYGHYGDGTLKTEYTEPVSLEELNSSSTYQGLIRSIMSKSLPEWGRTDEKIEDLFSNVSLSSINHHDKSSLDWLLTPPNDWPKGEAYPVMAQPYMFGDEASKKTCFWVKGLNQPLHATKMVDRGERVILSSGKSLPKWYSDALTKAKTTEERRTLRSKTFPGIADAIVKQWVLRAAVQEGIVKIEEWVKHNPTLPPPNISSLLEMK